jgi:hypothetical protein
MRAEAIPAIPARKKSGRRRSPHTEKAIPEAGGQPASGRARPSRDDHGGRGCARRGGSASIYRRSPSLGALALDAALGAYLADQPTRDTGTLEGDLLATARGWIRSVKRSATGPSLRFLTAKVQSDPSLAEACRDRFVREVRRRRRVIVERRSDAARFRMAVTRS